MQHIGGMGLTFKHVLANLVDRRVLALDARERAEDGCVQGRSQLLAIFVLGLGVL